VRFLLILFALAGCGDPATEDSDTGGSALLRDTHPGWRDPRCWHCHDPDETHNADLDPWECAACHGTNGAPTGHTAYTPCGDCHGAPHGQDGFPDPVACETCHTR
jgi:hypothetical protein